MKVPWIWTIIIIIYNIENVHPIDIHVQTSRAAYRINKNYIGVTINPDLLLKYNNINTLRNIKALSPNYVRFNKPLNDTISDNDIKILKKLYQDTNAKLIITVDPNIRQMDGTWDDMIARNLITILINNKIDIGLEMGYERIRKEAEKNGKLLAKDILALYSLKKEFSDYGPLLIIGPDMTSLSKTDESEKIKNIINIAGKSIDIFTWHPNRIQVNYEDDYEKIVSKATFATDVFSIERRAIYDFLRNLRSLRNPLWLDNNSGQKMKESKFIDAMLWASRLGQSARLGVDRIMYNLNKQDMIKPTPLYWISVLHQNLIGNKVLNVELDGRKSRLLNTYAYCTKNRKNNGSITMMFINYNKMETNINMEIPYINNINEINLYKYEITPGNNDIMSSDIYVNGKKPKLEGNGEVSEFLPKVVNIYNNPGYINQKMKGLSITFIVIPNAMANACLNSNKRIKRTIEYEKNTESPIIDKDDIETGESRIIKKSLVVEKSKDVETKDVADKYTELLNLDKSSEATTNITDVIQDIRQRRENLFNNIKEKIKLDLNSKLRETRQIPDLFKFPKTLFDSTPKSLLLGPLTAKTTLLDTDKNDEEIKIEEKSKEDKIVTRDIKPDFDDGAKKWASFLGLGKAAGAKAAVDKSKEIIPDKDVSKDDKSGIAKKSFFGGFGLLKKPLKGVGFGKSAIGKVDVEKDVVDKAVPGKAFGAGLFGKGLLGKAVVGKAVEGGVVGKDGKGLVGKAVGTGLLGKGLVGKGVVGKAVAKEAIDDDIFDKRAIIGKAVGAGLLGKGLFAGLLAKNALAAKAAGTAVAAKAAGAAVATKAAGAAVAAKAAGTAIAGKALLAKPLLGLGLFKKGVVAKAAAGPKVLGAALVAKKVSPFGLLGGKALLGGGKLYSFKRSVDDNTKVDEDKKAEVKDDEEKMNVFGLMKKRESDIGVEKAEDEQDEIKPNAFTSLFNARAKRESIPSKTELINEYLFSFPSETSSSKHKTIKRKFVSVYKSEESKEKLNDSDNSPTILDVFDKDYDWNATKILYKRHLSNYDNNIYTINKIDSEPDALKKFEYEVLQPTESNNQQYSEQDTLSHIINKHFFTPAFNGAKEFVCFVRKVINANPCQ